MVPWSTKGEPGEYVPNRSINVKGIWGEIQDKLPKLRLRVQQIVEEGDKEAKIATAQSTEVRDKAWTPLKKKSISSCNEPCKSHHNKHTHPCGFHVLFCYESEELGGNSFSPVEWGMVAVCNQRTWILPCIRCDQGQVNLFLYLLKKKDNSSCLLHRIFRWTLVKSLCKV